MRAGHGRCGSNGSPRTRPNIAARCRPGGSTFPEAGRALYVAADTGAVTARRSTLWRVYDFLWGLHIMDWRGHEDFNTPLLIAATALALAMSIAGIVLLPGRLGFTAWLRGRLRQHRPNHIPAA